MLFCGCISFTKIVQGSKLYLSALCVLLQFIGCHRNILEGKSQCIESVALGPVLSGLEIARLCSDPEYIILSLSLVVWLFQWWACEMCSFTIHTLFHFSSFQVAISILNQNLIYGIVTQYLEVREKQYDKKAYLDLFTVSIRSLCSVFSSIFIVFVC